MTSDLQADTEARSQLLNLIRSSQPMGIALIAVGVLALVIQIVVEPRGAAVLRVLSAAGKGMRLGPNQLTLRRTRWRRGWRKRRLVSGVLRYAPGQVTEDLGAELTEALGPFVAGELLIRWEPDRDRFVLRQRPTASPRLEQRHSTVGTMTRTLEHILGGLIVDQDHTNVADSGEVSQFVATYPQTTRDLAESFRQRLKVILDAKTPCPTGYWMVKLDPASSRITVQPSQPMPRLAELPLVTLTQADRMRIPVGVAAGGQIIYWEPASSPHMLLVGPTGSGKTIFINSMIDLVAARGWRIDLLDPKELSYRGYIPESLKAKGLPPWPGINRVATSELEMEVAIDDLYEELRERYYQLKIFGVTEQQLQPRLAIIDEAGEMVERLNAFHTSEAKYLALVEKAVTEGRNPDDVVKPKGTRNPLLLKLWSLLRLGRQAKIFVITATQRPDVNFIPGEARSNLVARVAMGKQDGPALDMVFNTRMIQQRIHETVTDPDTGEKLIKRIRGRATIDIGGGPVSVQTFWTPDPALVITGELDQDGVDLVARQYAYVCESAARWNQVNPTRSGLDAPPPVDIVDLKKKVVATALAADLAKPAEEVNRRAQPEQGQPAKSLTAGDLAILEIDGEQLTVEITDVDDDPTYLGEEGELRELQITYRIAEGHNRSGELGVTTLVENEKVLIDV
jgi:DNA segregation ATPase FtsK/SpoIIIE, S-DNA-T family